MVDMLAGSGGRGRPPDPGLQARVFEATLEQYAEFGWSGFTFDGVARRAQVGKAALYGRWGSKAALIGAALTDRLRQAPPVPDTGSLREDLLRVVRYMLGIHLSRDGMVLARARVEAMVWPEVFGQAQRAYQETVSASARDIVHRGMARGEIPADSSPELIIDCVLGALMNRVLSAPAGETGALVEVQQGYPERLVDFVLGAAGGGAG